MSPRSDRDVLAALESPWDPTDPSSLTRGDGALIMLKLHSVTQQIDDLADEARSARSAFLPVVQQVGTNTAKLEQVEKDLKDHKSLVYKVAGMIVPLVLGALGLQTAKGG